MRTFSWSATHKPENQDACLVGARSIVLSDGASPLTGGRESAIRTAQFSSALVEEVSRLLERGMESVSALREGLRTAQDKLGRDGGVHATLTSVTWTDTDITVATLGDSPAFLRREAEDPTGTSDNWVRIEDPQFDGKENRRLEEVTALVDGGKSWQEAYATVRESLVAERSTRNSADGVWIFTDSVDPDELARHIHVETFPRNGFRLAAVVSDGAAILFEEFGLCTREECLTAMDSRLLDALYRQAHELETADSERSRWPRFSYKDDASVVSVVFSHD